jgi:hypothetical protein
MPLLDLGRCMPAAYLDVFIAMGAVLQAVLVQCGAREVAALVINMMVSSVLQVISDARWVIKGASYIGVNRTKYGLKSWRHVPREKKKKKRKISRSGQRDHS